jgi:hypothetical protein
LCRLKDLLNWFRPDPAEGPIDLDDQPAWDALLGRYPVNRPERKLALEQCLAVAKSNSAQCCVIETRYLDRDYRSEYAAYHARTFRMVADATHRLHFFRRKLTAADLGRLPEGAASDYLGYVSVRPRQVGRVGRTMLMPPPNMRTGVRSEVTETVHFFGEPLAITAAPFMEQDTEFLRCAHVDAWMCHYAAHRRGDVGRHLSAEFALQADPSLAPYRPIPSEGLNLVQVTDVLRNFGLPPVFYNLESLPQPDRKVPWLALPVLPPPGSPGHPGYWDRRIIQLCCRYLNSGVPLIVFSHGHVFVLVGYYRDSSKSPSWISFIRHDDETGPYQVVADVFNDQAMWAGGTISHNYSPWEYIVVPLAERVLMTGEFAESAGALELLELANDWAAKLGFTTAAQLQALVGQSKLRVHTYLTTGNRYKDNLDDRGVDADLGRAYRLARWPGRVWVVEAVDRDLRLAGDDRCVLGEIIYDATSTDHDSLMLAAHAPGVAWLRTTEGEVFPLTCSNQPYRTGGYGSV